jgi:AcrR family transcriptional regulator
VLHKASSGLARVSWGGTVPRVTDRAPSTADPRVSRTLTTVLHTVNRLMTTEGSGSVTFARVSRESGVSRTTLYRHWDNPSALVADVWSQATADAIAHAHALEHDLVEQFTVVRDVAESPTMRRSLPPLLAAAVRDPDVAAMHAAFIADRRRPIVERLQRAVEDGHLRPEADLELLVDLMSGPIYYRQLLRRTDTSDDDVAAIVATVLASARP